MYCLIWNEYFLKSLVTEIKNHLHFQISTLPLYSPVNIDKTIEDVVTYICYSSHDKVNGLGDSKVMKYIVHWRNECLFFCVHGKWTWVRHVTNPVNREVVLGRFVTTSPKFISHECRKIRHSFLIFTISSNIPFSKSPREKKFWNSLLNRLAMTSFQ